MIRYFVVNCEIDKHGKYAGNEYYYGEENGFEDIQEAIKCAEFFWSHLHEYDKKYSIIEVREVESDDVEDFEEQVYSCYDIVKEFKL